MQGSARFKFRSVEQHYVETGGNGLYSDSEYDGGFVLFASLSVKPRMSDRLLVEVAYATPGQQKIIECDVATGTPVIEVVKQSNIQHYFPDINFDRCDLGVFGKVVATDYELVNGDRIEIYRALIADPKEVRRQRAAQGIKKPATKKRRPQSKS